MKNFWIVAVLVVVAGAAFFLGRRSGEPPAPAAVAASAPATPAIATVENTPQVPTLSTAPVRTFRGPDGRAYIIIYDEKNPPDSGDPEQVRQALLSDMKFFPTNIIRNYDLSADDVKAMLAGTKPIPDFMLPESGKPKRSN